MLFTLKSYYIGPSQDPNICPGGDLPRKAIYIGPSQDPNICPGGDLFTSVHCTTIAVPSSKMSVTLKNIYTCIHILIRTIFTFQRYYLHENIF